ncbi:MAG: SDR family oxidoreductase, partial [Acidimicrobiales bacterium]
AGHEVVGLARSDSAEEALARAGATTVRGDLVDLDILGHGARSADGVIHLAFRHDLVYAGDFMGAVEIDRKAIVAISDALIGTGKAFVGTSGTLALARAEMLSRPGTELDVAPEGPRVGGENAIIDLAQQGVRSSVVRLAPLVHSYLDRHGFGPTLINMARGRGFSAYVGEGSNRWPAVDTRDAARLYRLALESAPAGTRLHGVGDEGLPFGAIAGVIGRRLDLPVRSIGAEESAEQFGFLAPLVVLDDPTSNSLTRELLGWDPVYPGLLEDLEEEHYFETAGAAVR